MNALSELLSGGKIEADLDVISNHLEDFYKQLYCEDIRSRPNFDRLNLKTFSRQQSSLITLPFLESEITQSLDQLSGDKTPGTRWVSPKILPSLPIYEA